ncbi:MAG TPA: coniferyl aldehyde dehydrogenase [Dokdonella sp.]|uniref:coniferyl aldehyde dehydrogenase n=1 Tax=Dokdonella sp. TaxID=2291710 RepID=UPI0025B91DFA|nr:coniferyl aldehyde dehydrogenase [Dokdonella sp.]MBX3691305.1 coniferyl aldehyde dehydrogenase [Dokdonella sp.]MCW5567260.1 coniferyl aldehyde dehydrogenase [Dokdonella sp.]HNR92081.1 coniferyl aldehyde dehydrogenase [Dokdonella sp.]
MDQPNTSDLEALLARQRTAWAAKQPDAAQRLRDLGRLREAFARRLPDFVAAMGEDFGRRSVHESRLTDGMTVLREIDHLRRHLCRWMRPRRRLADWMFLPARTEVQIKPLGVVGIIAPWNYPVNLALAPLAAALAAGNHVMLKPSEHTPRTSELLRELLAEVFAEERVATVTGDAEVAARFAALPFDHLFFTGSTEVGRKVMAAAARNLVPVTLELGGKSPAIVAPDYPLDTAAERIAAGKFLNAGQTCIAPDYVFVPQGSQAAFVANLRACVERHYPALRESPDYSSIVSDTHYARLTALVEEARAAGCEVVTLPGADAHNAGKRVFAPTVIVDPPASLRVMQEEIFGPVLPVLGCASIDDAVAFVNARPRPLALYHFDHDRSRTRRVLAATIAGGVTVNDTVLHFAQSELPFGGIGPSGMGHYHGHAGFLAFSKQMPVLYQARWSSMGLLRPPYRKLADFVTKFLTR